MIWCSASIAGEDIGMEEEIKAIEAEKSQFVK